MLLAIDSATETLALAAVPLASGAPVHARESAGGSAASRLALPALLALLAEAGGTRADVRAIAFGRGPGGFTGLRTACAVAQGLAAGLDVPVLPIDSLLLVAEAAVDARPESAPTADGLVWVAMDARMDEIYAAAWRCRPGADGERRWEPVVEPFLTDPATLSATWAARRPALVAGSAVAVFGDRLEVAGAPSRTSPDGRAAALGRLARQAWADGAGRPAAEALPLYVRDRVALTTQERQDRRDAQAAASGVAAGEPDR